MRGFFLPMPQHRHPLLSFILLSTLGFTAKAQNLAFRDIRGKAQGTTYHISYRPAPDTLAHHVIDSLLHSVDRSLSLYDTGSLICAFNRSLSGIRMDKHMHRVVTSSLQYSASSKGAFDITVKPVMDAWGFGASEVTQIPDRRSIDSLKRIISYRHLTIRNDSLLKDDPRIRIDCNGIAQGYTVDLLAECLIAIGISDYLVELGGEIRLNGLNPDGLPWMIGIEGPRMGRTPGMDGFIQPGTGAVTSSGNYRNSRSIVGRTVGHVMDPRKARPASGRITSVCITAPDAMTADALDNTCLVLGVRKSIRWIRTMTKAETRLIYMDRHGYLKVKASKGFPPMRVQ